MIKESARDEWDHRLGDRNRINNIIKDFPFPSSLNSTHLEFSSTSDIFDTLKELFKVGIKMLDVWNSLTLNGLYDSPCTSSRLTLRPEIASWLMRKRAAIAGDSISCPAPGDRLMLPLRVGGFPSSIFPTVHWRSFDEVSKEYFPWLCTSVQFLNERFTKHRKWSDKLQLQTNTALGIWISMLTSSSTLPILCFGPIVSSNRPKHSFTVRI